jgi:hypothetical protein
MKATFLAALALFLTASSSRAQDLFAGNKPQPIPTEHIELSSTLVEPAGPANASVLPDAPVPKTIAPPCPAGPRKPCAFLSGRPFLHDRFALSAHDPSWVKAMSNPAIIGGTALEVAAFVMDYKTTRYCLDRHLGKEGNPIMGQSRAQELGVGISITAIAVFANGKTKEIGNGNLALFEQWAAILGHGMFAYMNAEKCGEY